MANSDMWWILDFLLYIEQKTTLEPLIERNLIPFSWWKVILCMTFLLIEAILLKLDLQSECITFVFQLSSPFSSRSMQCVTNPKCLYGSGANFARVSMSRLFNYLIIIIEIDNDQRVVLCDFTRSDWKVNHMKMHKIILFSTNKN